MNDEVEKIDKEFEWRAFQLPELTWDGRVVFELVDSERNTHKVVLVPVDLYEIMVVED